MATPVDPDFRARLAALNEKFAATVPGTLTLRPEWWATGLLIAILGTLVSAAQSLWRVWHLPLLEPAQPRAWARASEASLRLQFLLALLLFAAALGLGIWGRGLVAGFAVLAGLLLGAALALPILLSMVLVGLHRMPRGPMGQWL